MINPPPYRTAVEVKHLLDFKNSNNKFGTFGAKIYTYFQNPFMLQHLLYFPKIDFIKDYTISIKHLDNYIIKNFPLFMFNPSEWMKLHKEPSYPPWTKLGIDVIQPGQFLIVEFSNYNSILENEIILEGIELRT